MVGWKSTLASSRSLNWHTHEEKSLHGKSHLLPDRASTVTTSIPVYLPLTHSTRSVSLLELTTVSRTQDCSLATLKATTEACWVCVGKRDRLSGKWADGRREMRSVAQVRRDSSPIPFWGRGTSGRAAGRERV